MLLRIFMILALFAAGAHGLAPAGTQAGEASSQEFAEARDEEAAARKYLYNGFERWDPEKLREFGRTVNHMPDTVAAEAIWMVASAPTRFDTSTILMQTLSADSPVVRKYAADVLVVTDTPDTRRMVMNTLATDKDDEVIEHIVAGLAKYPPPRAVANMMDIMFFSGVKPAGIKAAAAHLRRLTKANLPDNAGDWRDWWLDNEHYYTQ